MLKRQSHLHDAGKARRPFTVADVGFDRADVNAVLSKYIGHCTDFSGITNLMPKKPGQLLVA
jgi:hypothetical protein